MTQNKAPKSSFWQLVASTLFAALGVQRRENLERDFAQSSPFPFIVAGILFTVTFVVSLIVLVNIVL